MKCFYPREASLPVKSWFQFDQNVICVKKKARCGIKKNLILTKFEALELWEPQNRIQRKILHGLKKKAGLQVAREAPKQPSVFFSTVPFNEQLLLQVIREAEKQPSVLWFRSPLLNQVLLLYPRIRGFRPLGAKGAPKGFRRKNFLDFFKIQFFQ